jgi:Predicted integral membrane protein
MAQHTANASVVVSAPAHQVFALWSHFNDFPKFMRHVREVTYYDEQRSHWVVDVLGLHEWDAVNENWIEGRQIGWRSTDGLENRGVVTFDPVDDSQTRITVQVTYDPPGGVVGDVVNSLGGGVTFENALQEDLNHFGRLVAEAGPGALDPHSSNYLFHRDSAAAQGTTTPAQNETMDEDDAEFLANNPPLTGTRR